MREMEIGVYDGIPGMDWLAQHSPMTCHWQEKWVQFQHAGEPGTLCGVQSTLIRLQRIYFSKLFCPCFGL